MTNPIANPWHSRPIDVHRWSEHPEAASLVDRLWESHFQDFDQPHRSGPKPKTSFKQQFKVLILDLLVAWKTDPELCIGVPMSSNAWDTNSRYNALRISKKIIPLIRRANQVGLVDIASGSYAGPYGPANRNTRIRASDLLQETFASVALKEDDIERHPGQECFVLKDGERFVEYEDDDNTLGMRERLTAYNALMERTFIDIPSLEHPYVDRPGPDEGQAERVPITADRKFVRRIFSRGRWDMNGRFYGPWWQQVGKVWRSQVFINDEPTVEIDFKGLHVNLLSHEACVVIEGDPYELPGAGLPEATSPLQRQLVKRLVLRAINAPNMPSAFSSFRQDWPTGHLAKRLTNQQLSGLLDLFIARHPHLADKLCADLGIRLMYLDSKITDQVLTVATNFELPVLGVHDSFIVAQGEQDMLTQIVETATREILGTEFPIEVSEPAFLPVRSQGYLARQERHRDKYG